MSRTIKLTKGYVSIVDDEDYVQLNRFNWQVSTLRNDGVCARRVCGCPFSNGLRHTICMHRQIMSCPQRKEVDHINHDRLNNQKENLRICSRSENMQNCSVKTGSRSKYKGVSWHRRDRKWLARIKVGSKHLRIGCFLDEREAARAYDVAAKKHFKQFAYTNF